MQPETQVSEFVADLSFADLPTDVVETVTRAFVDTVGVTLAGTVSGAGRRTAEAAGVDPNSAAPATLLGVAGTEAPEAVALRTGTASHALDYDDLSWAMDGHPSVTLIPTVLALAAKLSASGRDFITAYVAGFEAECAIAAPISPDHYETGWHATATFGTFGATAAAASLLDLDPQTTAHALSAAASMPAGLKRNFGSETKPLHAGLCSRSGVTAARLAAAGLTADAAAISGDRGFWDLYDPAQRGSFSIGDEWALQTEGIHVKTYPCCYFTHTSIAAAQRLVNDGVDPTAVDRVEVRASQGAADALHHANPDTGLEAKFSMEYAVASGLVRDRVGLKTFQEDAIGDPDVQRVRERVMFTVDESLNYDSHQVTVRATIGDDFFERHQENPPGTHDNPLSESDMRAKFTDCAELVLDAAESDRLYRVLADLPAHADAVAALSGRE
jgi:2-methylcitrate dehydratase PrpD